MWSSSGTGARRQNCCIWKIHASRDSDFLPVKGGSLSGLMRGAGGVTGLSATGLGRGWVVLTWLESRVIWLRRSAMTASKSTGTCWDEEVMVSVLGLIGLLVW